MQAENTFTTELMNFIIQGKIVNKPNRNDYSYRVKEIIIDFNIEQLEYSSLPASDLSFATPNTKQSSSIFHCTIYSLFHKELNTMKDKCEN